MALFKKRPYDSFIAWSKMLDRRVSSAALILEDSTGRALIVKANYKPYWTFPGGVVDKDETPLQAAIRETAEEVGISVDAKDISFVAVIDRKSDVIHTYQFLFKAVLTETMLKHVVLQETEIDEFALVTKQDVQKSERTYGKVIEHWVDSASGYVEQKFDLHQNG